MVTRPSDHRYYTTVYYPSKVLLYYSNSRLILDYMGPLPFDRYQADKYNIYYGGGRVDSQQLYILVSRPSRLALKVEYSILHVWDSNSTL